MDPAAGSPRSDDDAIFEYWAGNPTVEISHGHICVARGRRSPGQEQKLPRDALDDHASGSSAATSSSVVLASAVPCYMSASEFCEFVGAFSEDSHRWFRHCRVLHGRNPEEYMIACWLASPEAARAVIRQHDGRPYNTIEAGVCQLHPVVGCLRNNWLADEQSACSRNCGPSPEKRSSPAGSPAPDFAALGAAMAQEVGRSPARRSLSPASRAATRRARRASRSPALEYAMPHPVARSPLPLSPARAPAQARLSPARAPALARELRAPELAELDAPFLADPRDLFAGCAAPQADGAGLGGSACTPGAGSALAAGPSPMMEPRASEKERPFCAVCLDPVDPNPEDYQLTELGGGVPLTILCGHTFHSRCLSRWCDATCPVCRFQQHPYKNSCCEVCGQSESLNICLVCGFIGCVAGQGEGHAQQHFEDTSHTYALDVITQRVWDYSGNGYVHRLLYNHQDGKMVEHAAPQPQAPLLAAGSAADAEGECPALAAAVAEVAGAPQAPAAAASGAAGGVLSELARNDVLLHGGCVAAKKQESVVSEFNALLASQMTEQRRFFEERQRDIQHAHDKRVEELRERGRDVRAALEASRMRLEDAEGRNASLEGQIAGDAAAEEVARRQVRALEALNRKFSGEQRRFEDELAGKERRKKAEQQRRGQEVEELQGEIRELELFLQMRRRCQASGDAADLQASNMVVLEGEPARGRGGRRGRRR